MTYSESAVIPGMLCKVQLQSHVHGTVLVVMDRCPQRQVLPLFIVGQFSELNEAHWRTAGQFSELIFFTAGRFSVDLYRFL